MLLKDSVNLNPFVVMSGINKTFTNVHANNDINLEIFESEIHALLGENGAGKSTLMKILYGFYRMDSGEILLRNKSISIKSPQDARTYKIGMVFQDFTQIPAFTVLENIALFLPHLGAVFNQKEIEEQINEIAERYGLHIDPYALISDLSIGEQQKVEILKLLLSNAKLLILDEPTRVLAPHEVESLFVVLDNLKKDGYAIIIITHKFKEVFACSNRITVLREGKVSGTMLRTEATEKTLIEMMFSRELPQLQKIEEISYNSKDVAILKLTDINTDREGNNVNLKKINLEIFPGEIVGVAGVSGNGQKELGDIILGMDKSLSGEKLLMGEDFTNCSIGKIRRNGVGFIPENPLLMSSIPFMTVLENMVLTDTDRYSKYGGLQMDWPAVKSDYKNTMEKLGFTFPFYSIPKSLSGGNLQKTVIVREMTHNPHLLIALYITRGLDVQSTIAVHKALIQARENRSGVLLISEDLEELFTLSDRLIVLFKGQIVGSFRPAETTMYKIGLLMTGAGVHNDN